MATYEHNEHIKHAEEDFFEGLEYEHVAYIMLDHIGYHMGKKSLFRRLKNSSTKINISCMYR